MTPNGAVHLQRVVVQREACGLNGISRVLQAYGVPNEVLARMGPLAMPSIDSAKTMAG